MNRYDPVFEAQEDLQIINEALDRMNERHRVPLLLCAGALYEERRKLIADRLPGSCMETYVWQP